MEALWQVLLHATADHDDPLSCEECFVLMDYLADLLSTGHPADLVLAMGEKYLQRCPECRQEHRRAIAEFLLAPDEDQQRATKRPPNTTRITP
jgi:predicted anti-sigma-YlaC factor YlaD